MRRPASIRVLPHPDLVGVDCCADKVEVAVAVEVTRNKGDRSVESPVDLVRGPAPGAPVPPGDLSTERSSAHYVHDAIAIHVGGAGTVGPVETGGDILPCPGGVGSAAVRPQGDGVEVVGGADDIQIAVRVHVRRAHGPGAVEGVADDVLGPYRGGAVHVLPPGDLVDVGGSPEDVQVSVSVDVTCADRPRAVEGAIDDLAGPDLTQAVRIDPESNVDRAELGLGGAENIHVPITVDIVRPDRARPGEQGIDGVPGPSGVVLVHLLPPGDLAGLNGGSDEIDVAVPIYVRGTHGGHSGEGFIDHGGDRSRSDSNDAWQFGELDVGAEVEGVLELRHRSGDPRPARPVRLRSGIST